MSNTFALKAGTVYFPSDLTEEQIQKILGKLAEEDAALKNQQNGKSLYKILVSGYQEKDLQEYMKNQTIEKLKKILPKIKNKLMKVSCNVSTKVEIKWREVSKCYPDLVNIFRSVIQKLDGVEKERETREQEIIRESFEKELEITDTLLNEINILRIIALAATWVAEEKLSNRYYINIYHVLNALRNQVKIVFDLVNSLQPWSEYDNPLKFLQIVDKIAIKSQEQAFKINTFLKIVPSNEKQKLIKTTQKKLKTELQEYLKLVGRKIVIEKKALEAIYKIYQPCKNKAKQEVGEQWEIIERALNELLEIELEEAKQVAEVKKELEEESKKEGLNEIDEELNRQLHQLNQESQAKKAALKKRLEEESKENNSRNT